MTLPPTPPTLLDARTTLLDRLRALGAPVEVSSFVRRNADLVAPELEVDGGLPVVSHILETLAFLEGRKAPRADRELAAAYFSALLKCAARVTLRKPTLANRSEHAREEYVREMEQSARAGKAEDVSFRVVGMDGEDSPYDIMAPRRINDGPEKHYLRDRRYEVKVQEIEGLLSLPCLACAGKSASDPCAPECVVPGGRCGAAWFKAIPPEMLGPFWDVYVRAHRTLSQETSTVEGRRGAKWGREGPTGKPGGAPKKHDSKIIYEVLDILIRLGLDQTLQTLEDKGYPDWEARQLVREAQDRLPDH